MDVPLFVYSFTHWETFGFFPVWVNYETCCYQYLCRGFCENINSHFSRLIRRRWKVGHMVSVCLTSYEIAKLFQNCTILHSHQQCIEVPLVLHSCYHVALSFVYILTILIGVCGTSYLICISLLNDDAVYFLKCLFTIDISSLVSVQILWQFLKIVLFIFLFLSYENSLQILNTSHLLPPHFWKRLYRIDITIIF